MQLEVLTTANTAQAEWHFKRSMQVRVVRICDIRLWATSLQSSTCHATPLCSIFFYVVFTLPFWSARNSTMISAEAGHQASGHLHHLVQQHVELTVLLISLVLYLQKLDIKLQGISIILCNDKKSSFGAPDVLQACADQVALVYKRDAL